MTRRPGRRALRLASYLRHIVEAIGRIRAYTAGIAEDDFSRRPMIQDAVIRNFEVIGEACRNVLLHHGEFAAAHVAVPWHLAYETRNALAHGYFEVDLARVWATIHADLPGFEAQVVTLLDTLDATPSNGQSGVQ